MPDQHGRLQIEELQHLADQGDDDASYNLGLRYHTGDGVEQDFAKAKEYYERAAEHSHPNALCNLGIMYSQGHGVEVDEQIGALLIRQAADQGQPNAQLTLAGMYYEGEGVEQDYVKAFEYYELAEANGLSDAKISLGHMYLGGLGTEKDEVKAAALFEEMAKRGNTQCQYLAGKAAYEGHTPDGEPDLERAAYWFMKAADGGDAGAMVQMAAMFQEGEGVEQSDHQSIVMMGRAALAGDDNALNEIARYSETLDQHLEDLARDAPLTITFDDDRRAAYIATVKSLSSLQNTVMNVAEKLERAGKLTIDRSNHIPPHEMN